MTTIVTRAGKGLPLSNNEMDTNLTNLNSFKVEVTTSTGSAVLPVGTTAQRDAIPVDGYLRYNSTTGKPEVYSGGAWGSVGGGATGGGSDTVFQVNGRTVTTAYEIPADSGASVVGPLTLNAALTFGANARLVVL
jgi:hypothetical protein